MIQRRLHVWLCILFGLHLCGLINSGVSAQEIPTVTFFIERYVVEGENPLGDAETQAALAPFTGEQEGLNALQDAAKALEAIMRERGYTFHRVIIPAQRATEGEFQLEVLSFKLDEVDVQGNVHFTDENIRASLPVLVPGATPNARLLSRFVQAANEHPSKRLNVTVRQSKKPDHIDAVVEVRDIKPQQFFMSLNNRGSDETGNFRAALGYQHSNLFGKDHVFTASYTTSPNRPEDVKQVGLFYQVPVYRHAGSLSAFFAFSDVDTGVVADIVDVSGAGLFYGARYTHAFRKIDAYTHKAVVSLEDKKFDSSLKFLAPGAPRSNETVRSRPISLEYRGTYGQPWGSLNFNVAASRNIGTGPSNNGPEYRLARCVRFNPATGACVSGADPSWSALRYGADVTWLLPQGWELRGRLEGQQSRDLLISGEQFGAGGASSVRGFNEREISGDSGEQFSVELHTPRWKQSFRFLAFLDWPAVTRSRRHSVKIVVRSSPASVSVPAGIGKQTSASARIGVMWSTTRTPVKQTPATTNCISPCSYDSDARATSTLRRHTVAAAILCPIKRLVA